MDEKRKDWTRNPVKKKRKIWTNTRLIIILFFWYKHTTFERVFCFPFFRLYFSLFIFWIHFPSFLWCAQCASQCFSYCVFINYSIVLGRWIDCQCQHLFTFRLGRLVGRLVIFHLLLLYHISISIKYNNSISD